LDLSEDPSFREVLMRVKETALGAFAHATVPLQKLLSEIKPERGDVWLKRHSMFQVMFSFQTIRFPDSHVGGKLDLSRLTNLVRFTIPHPSAKCDLYLYLRELNGRLIGGFEYDTDVFDRETILRFGMAFEILLRAAAADIDAPISHLPIMPPGQRTLMLHGWNDTRVVYPEELCLHQHFAEQVRRTPDLPAVSCGDDVLSYCELARKAAACARRLAGLGVGPEIAVGLFLERSLGLAVGILGVLQAGGVCVPLEPSTPADRLHRMLDDAEVALILSDRSLGDDLPRWPCSRVVFVDEIDLDSSPRPPAAAVAPDNAAFIFFTSGSTGQPNGVVVTHRAAAAGQCAETAGVRLQTGDRILLTAPVSSARLLGELFWPLFVGGQVCMARPDAHQDYRYVLDEIARHGISVVSMVPAMLATVLQGDLAQCASLRTVFAIGEQLPAPVRAAFCERIGADLCNVYAQTEACPVTFFSMRNHPDRPAATIGRPTANTRVYVLDTNLEPVPIGVAGDVYVAGNGLARGYRGKPALTAAKFIPDPFSGRPGGRMYRTGDVAKFLASGDLVSLGRRDLRVKVRGYRIELQEIETVLLEHPAVKEAAVLSSHGGDDRLTCFVATRVDIPVRANELRRMLKQRLPLYMVPASFVFLDQLPRNRSGKVDRLALSQHGQAGRVHDEFVAPCTSLEILIAGIWRSVLKLERIGANDNFFDLGGDSLTAIEAIARIKDLADVSVRPRDMIFATLGQIARGAEPTGT
jgi:amino acid adenylation domain-containing protein